MNNPIDQLQAWMFSNPDKFQEMTRKAISSVIPEHAEELSLDMMVVLRNKIVGMARQEMNHTFDVV